MDHFPQELVHIFTLPDAVQQQQDLVTLLEAHGFQYSPRTAENILLLRNIFNDETLQRIIASALKSPSPDLALNSFERLASVTTPENIRDLVERKKTLFQCLLLCGSSPFLVNLMYKTPEILSWLFLEKGIDISRSES